jgi:hypothetical protein
MRRLTHSPVFQVFHRAIFQRQQVTCRYGGYRREVCPHVLGHKDGNEVVLVYQFGGESARALPPGGEWRCLQLAAIEDAVARAGPWHSGGPHRRVQRCVDVVYIDVNTSVPNQPGRRPSLVD